MVRLVDRTMGVNEVINLINRFKTVSFVLKVNFKKAYHLVSWSFLEYMLIRFRFSEKWRCWMRVCVFIGNLAVLVNECPTQEINIQRGLKQGGSSSSIPFPAYD